MRLRNQYMLTVIVLAGEFILLALLQAAGITSRPDGYMLILIVLAVLAYLLDVFRKKSLIPVRKSLTSGLIFRLFLLLWDTYGRDVYMLPHSGSDSEGYFSSSVQVANGATDVYGGTFSVVMGHIFRFIGVSRLYGQFLIICFSIVAIHIADKIMRMLSISTRCRKRAMLILCLLPNFAILSSVFMRESIITMFVALSLLLFICWWNGSGEWCFIGAFVAVAVAAMFHSGVMGVAAGYILIRLLYDRKKRAFHLNLKSVIPAVLAFGVFVFLYNNYADVFFGKMQGVESISDVGSTAERGGSTYGSYVGNSDSILNMIIYTPIRIIMFQFSPFFWQFRGLSDIIAFCFGSTFYLYIWIKTIAYIASKKEKHRTLIIALAIIGFATSFVFAWGVTNTGTAIRHRDKMVVLYAVLMGLLWDAYKSDSGGLNQKNKIN